MTDIEIANSIKPKPIIKIAKKLGVKPSALELFGSYKAKIKPLEKHNNSKLILVTAINPTASGNGKTTVAIGLADAFSLKHKKVCLALREPSLGPVFGIKGGATGGGYSQVVPMEDINLHFNGDFHAITSANNLLASIIDNHIFQGNALNIDPENVFFHRCLDLNDRALRETTVAQSNKAISRQESFTITAASEIMAIMCLATDIENLKARLGNILVGLNKKGGPVYACDLTAQDAMAILLKDALKPNLVQTLAGTPALIHCGPFANIAHGCNSIIATKTAMSLAEYVVTEAGFGADLGAEKFFDVKCRLANIKPSAVVLVTTIRALKLHGGANKNALDAENTQALKMGLPNLLHHINVLKNVFKVPFVVTLNKFSTDTQKEIEIVKTAVSFENVDFCENDVWAKGGKGAIELCEKVIKECEKPNNFEFAYDTKSSLKEKIKCIATKIYGAKRVVYSKDAEVSLKTIKKLQKDDLPIVIAKTQYSLSDNANLLGKPKNFDITVREIELKSGAGFIVVCLGDMLLMPGLTKTPAYLKMEIDKNEKISGIY